MAKHCRINESDTEDNSVIILIRVLFLKHERNLIYFLNLNDAYVLSFIRRQALSFCDLHRGNDE